jgi:hypothetical protein
MSEERRAEARTLMSNGNGNGQAHIGGEPLVFHIKLNVPVEHGGEMLHELTLTEPTFEEMEKIGRAPEADRGRLTLQLVTGLPPSVVRQLRGRDINAINEMIPKLLGEDESPPTGGR